MEKGIVYVAAEDDLLMCLGERICQSLNLQTCPIRSGGGKSKLKGKLASYNKAAKGMRWLVLRDLDHDRECAAALLRILLPSPSPHMRLRIAVRAAEAWLLADRTSAAGWLGVSLQRLPQDPDELDDPKLALVNLARGSRLSAITKGLVPRMGSGAVVGPEYRSQVSAYVRDRWRPDCAAAHSPSLARTIRRLQEWV